MGEELYDLAVVGAGPAGATTAILAARRGLRVALIDRQTFPRDKTCGDGIGPTAVRALRAIGVGDIFDGCTPVRDVTIYGPGGEQLAGPIPAIDGEPAYGYVIPRIEFDQRLFDRALAEGASNFEGHRFTGMRLRAGSREIDLRTSDETELTIQARLVVGADGAYSAVRRLLDPPTPEQAKSRTLLAMRAYADSGDFAPGTDLGPRLLFEFTRDLLPSYGWIFPAGDGRINIGVGGPIPILHKRGIDLKTQIRVFADQMTARGIEIGELREVRAHQLPHVAGLARLAHPRAVLLGDAASMINPVSGEGIAYAVTAACQLARMLPDTLADADTLQNALERFERAFRRDHRAHFASIRISSAMLHSKTWASVLLDAAQRDPKVLEDGVNLLFGFGRIQPRTLARIARSGWRRQSHHIE
jgi:geranylgeranyl reductase family protein